MIYDAVILGGGGFIGGHLTTELLSQSKRVKVVDIKDIKDWQQVHEDADNYRFDLRDIQQAREAVKGAKTVYNLACDMGGIGFIETNKAACMLSVLISTNSLKAAHENDTCDKYFYSSSACVYNGQFQDSEDVTELEESMAYPANPEDGYGWEKLFSERMCRHFYEDYGFEARVARLHNIYGPNGTYKGGREKSIAAICRKVAEAKINNQDMIEIWGDGNQVRSFTYIDDCVKGIQLITNGENTDPVNLGSSEHVTINNLVKLVEEIAGVDLKKKHDLSKPQGVRGRSSDNTLINELYSWEPSTSLADGVTSTYNWIYAQILKEQ